MDIGMQVVVISDFFSSPHHLPTVTNFHLYCQHEIKKSHKKKHIKAHRTNSQFYKYVSQTKPTFMGHIIAFVSD